MNKKPIIQPIIQDYGKIPPQAVDLEEVVLGALLLEQDAVNDISEKIKPEFFYKEAHQKIFTEILQLHRNNSPVDMLTVTEALRQKALLEEVGGVMYITQLTSRVASASHVEYHVAIITQKYVQREIIKACSNLSTLAFNEDTDPQDILDEAENSFSEINDIFAAGSSADELPELLNNSLDSFDQRFSNFQKGFSNAIKTPLFDLTKLLHGWQKGDFILLAARPSMGKTAFALAIAQTAAKTNSVLFFSLEMTAEKLADRMIIGQSGVNSDNYFEGNLSPYEFELLEEARDKLCNLKISIVDRSSLTIEQIRAIAKNKQRKGKCDFIIIDYLGLIKPSSGNKSYNRTHEIGEVSRKIKSMAKDLDVPVVCLSQLNRECEKRSDRRPHLSDLRDSGDIEQDCDVAMFLFRPAAYPDIFDITEDAADVGEINVEKHRNGRTGRVKFKYSPNMTRFYDIDIPSEQSDEKYYFKPEQSSIF